MLDVLRRWLFPVACLGCGRADVALCAACSPPHGAALEIDAGDLRVRAVAPYEGLWRRAIVAFKGGERAYAGAFADLLRSRYPRDCAVVPVTTTRRRRAARGFDQSSLLATAYAGGDVLDALRKRPGPAQHGMGRSGRLASRGRFELREPALVAGRRVVLLDDVCTTGATLQDAARALREGGAQVVRALVLASPACRNGFGPVRYPMPGREHMHESDLARDDRRRE